MPLDRSLVTQALKILNRDAATPEAIARKLTKLGNGPSFSASEVEAFLNRAVSDSPQWIECVGHSWRLFSAVLTEEDEKVVEVFVADFDLINPGELRDELRRINADPDFPEDLRESNQDLEKVPDYDLLRKFTAAKWILFGEQRFKERAAQLQQKVESMTRSRDDLEQLVGDFRVRLADSVPRTDLEAVRDELSQRPSVEDLQNARRALERLELENHLGAIVLLLKRGLRIVKWLCVLTFVLGLVTGFWLETTYGILPEAAKPKAIMALNVGGAQEAKKPSTVAPEKKIVDQKEDSRRVIEERNKAKKKSSLQRALEEYQEAKHKESEE